MQRGNATSGLVPMLAGGTRGTGYNFAGTISACYATGDATGTGSDVGGLVGYNESTISACYATGDATGTGNVGGLVGSNESTISACYATGDATGTGDNVGGLVGQNNSGTISACYATGDATGTGNVGGLVGFNFFATVTNSYFDSTVSNRTAADSYDKTTVQLQTPMAYGTAMEIYANWNVDVDGDGDSDDPWDFGTGSEYPALRVDFNGDGIPTAFLNLEYRGELLRYLLRLLPYWRRLLMLQ